MTRLYIACAVAAVFAAAPALHAAQIVNLSPSTSWVTSNTSMARSVTEETGDFGKGASADDGRAIVPFDTTTPYSPSGDIDDSFSDVFYGGFQIIRADDTGNLFPRNRINDGGADNDSIELGANSASGAYTGHWALLWKKEDFLNGGAGAQVDITSTDSLSAEVSGQFFGQVTFRWLVQIGGDFFVSDDSVTLGNSLTTFNSADLTTVDWAEVDLETSIDAAVGTFGALALTDIQGVGLYASGQNAGDDASRRITVGGFTAEGTIQGATVIPTPAALPAGLALLGLTALRRRH